MVTPTHLSPDRIQSIAEETSRAFGYDSDFDIFRVVEGLGGRVVHNDFWDNRSSTGSLVVKRLRDFEILVPTHTTETRDQFTIAHELAHYILHYLPNVDPRHESPFRIDRYGDTIVEKEANLFAYAFLMPKEKFSDVYRKLHGNVRAIANEFRVSDRAALSRVRMLGLDEERKSKASRGSADFFTAQA